MELDCDAQRPADASSKSSVKKANKAAAKLAAKSVDSQVQHTNDDSIVSKRSASRHGYIEDPFLRHFVSKLSRRAPLINRGYYLRMAVMTSFVEHTLRVLLRQSEQQHVQVISLGAGFDTLAARFYSRPEFHRVHFFEVDFPEVIRNKTILMQNAPLSQFPFVNARVVDGKEVVGDRYAALGLDLRQASTDLVPLLSRGSGGRFSPAAPTVVYAECVMQYMTPECSSGIVRWVATHLKDAVFFAYDQLHHKDSFGATMTKSLLSKCSPLIGVESFPDGLALSRRAQAEGLQFVRFTNFFNVSRHVLHGAEAARVEAIEAFDEFEEWGEMCEHYGILCGSTNPALGKEVVESLRMPRDVAGGAAEEDAPVFVDMLSNVEESCVQPPLESQHVVGVAPWPNGRCGVEGWAFGGVQAEQRSGDTFLVAFGGLLATQGQARSSAVLVHSMANGDVPVIVTSSSTETPPALVFHTFTKVGPWQYLVFGGRTNPNQVYRDLFLLQLDPAEAPVRVSATWKKISVLGCDAPCARYRHASVVLRNSMAATRTVTLAVHGGRTAHGTVLGDLWCCVVDTLNCTATWRELTHDGRSASTEPSLPVRVFSAALVAVDSCTLLLSGGAHSLNLASGYFYVFKLDEDSDGTPSSIRQLYRSKASLGTPRFSHAMVASSGQWLPESLAHWRTERLMLIHGGTPSCTKPADDLRSFLVYKLSDCLAPSSGETLSEGADVDCYRLAVPSGSLADTTWTRHDVVPVDESVGLFALIGGGFTAFSFGTYSTRPRLVCLAGETLLSSSQKPTECRIADEATASSASSEQMKPVPSASYDAPMFSKIVRSAVPDGPLCFRSVPLGPCVERWSDPCATVAESGDAEALISVHVSNSPTQSHFDFVVKNFAFKHVTLRRMVRHCFHDSASSASPQHDEAAYWYFRSVGRNMKTDRSDFWQSFPHLAKDVQLPADDAWSHIRAAMHQSCFRINQSGMQLWTHHDTTDNVLLQIVGQKRVILFPPSQMTNLYTKGSSSRVTNPDAPDLQRFPRFAEALKHAMVVVLKPGDMLFIPANWWHHVTALTSCIGLNLFYLRPSMDASLFDARDLYGNKDLPCCTALRARLVSDVLSSVKSLEEQSRVPHDYAAFTLRQLIQDLEEAAEQFERSGRQ